MMKNYPSIYFFCLPSGPPEKSTYHHTIISIAEGLQELKIPYYCNINYWKQTTEENSCLFRKSDDVNYQECDLVIFSSEFFSGNRFDELPKELFLKNRKYKLIFIDYADTLITPGFSEIMRSADIILKAHYNKKYTYPGNFRPWQFGLTNRIINAVNPLPFQQRNKEILNNFRVGHYLRYIAQQKIMPIIEEKLKINDTTENFDQVKEFDKLSYQYWAETGRRHYPSYYKRLSSAYACSCFGGIVERKKYFSDAKINTLIEKIEGKIRPLTFDRIYQFDSWRFWESLVAGSCTVHIDLEKYGAVFPVMPEKNQEYLGIDLSNLKALRELLEDNTIYERIGNKGRAWALENYAPLPVAKRFLQFFYDSAIFTFL